MSYRFDLNSRRASEFDARHRRAKVLPMWKHPAVQAADKVARLFILAVLVVGWAIVMFGGDR